MENEEIGVGEDLGNQPETDAITSESQSQAPDALTVEANQPTETDLPAQLTPEARAKMTKDWNAIHSVLDEIHGQPLDRKAPLADRLTAVQQAYNQRVEQLAELQAQGEFVGIKVDAPVDQWNVKEQLDALPAPVQNKLVNEVFNEHLPTLIDETLANPQAYPEALKMLQRSAATIVEGTYGRPVGEVDRILLELTRGLPIEYIAAALQNGGGQPPNNGYGAQNGAPTSLASQLISQGYEPTDPMVQAARQQEMLTSQQQSAYTALERQVQQLLSAQQQAQESQAQQAQRTAHEAVDKQAEAARQGVLDSVLKGRVPADKLPKVQRWIDRDAQAELSANQKATTALALAKQFQADGLEGKAKAQMGFYLAIADKVYKATTAEVLAELVGQAQTVRTTDQAKAERKEIGAATGAISLNNPGLVNRKLTTEDDVGDYAAALYRSHNP